MDNINADIYDEIIENIFLQSSSFLDFYSQVSNLYTAMKSFDLDETITNYRTKYFNQIRNSLIDNQDNIGVSINLEAPDERLLVEIQFEYDDIDTLTEKISWENKVLFFKILGKIRNMYEDVDIDIGILYYDPEYHIILQSSSTLKKNENKIQFEGGGAYINVNIAEEPRDNITPIWFYESIRFRVVDH